jgi:tellurite resistance protein TehA-like permease
MKFTQRLLSSTLTTLAPLAALAVTSAALAQATGPRQPKVDAVPSPVIGYGIFLVFAAIVLAISLYPSKRAHSDL